MIRIFAVILASATLNACAGQQRQWTKAGATSADVEQAKLECQYEAMKTERDAHGIVGGAAEAVRNVNLQVMCLRVKGYELS